MLIDKMLLGRRIKPLREDKGFSQKDLGNKLLKTQQAIDAWERGIAVPATNVLFNLADIFCVSADYLLGRTTVKELASKEKVKKNIDETIENADISVDTKRMIRFLLDNERIRSRQSGNGT